MAAIFREKQRKNTKNSRILAKTNKIFKLNCYSLCRLYGVLYFWNKRVFQKFQKNKMAAIFQCKSVNIKENAIKNELIDIKRSR